MHLIPRRAKGIAARRLAHERIHVVRPEHLQPCRRKLLPVCGLLRRWALVHREAQLATLFRRERRGVAVRAESRGGLRLRAGLRAARNLRDLREERRSVVLYVREQLVQLLAVRRRRLLQQRPRGRMERRVQRRARPRDRLFCLRRGPRQLRRASRAERALLARGPRAVRPLDPAKIARFQLLVESARRVFTRPDWVAE